MAQLSAEANVSQKANGTCCSWAICCSLASKIAQLVSLDELCIAVQEEFKLCMLHLHMVERAAISHDVIQGLTADWAALHWLLFSFLQQPKC